VETVIEPGCRETFVVDNLEKVSRATVIKQLTSFSRNEISVCQNESNVSYR